MELLACFGGFERVGCLVGFGFFCFGLVILMLLQTESQFKLWEKDIKN